MVHLRGIKVFGLILFGRAQHTIPKNKLNKSFLNFWIFARHEPVRAALVQMPKSFAYFHFLLLPIYYLFFSLFWYNFTVYIIYGTGEVFNGKATK